MNKIPTEDIEKLKSGLSNISDAMLEQMTKDTAIKPEILIAYKDGKATPPDLVTTRALIHYVTQKLKT